MAGFDDGGIDCCRMKRYSFRWLHERYSHGLVLHERHGEVMVRVTGQ